MARAEAYLNQIPMWTRKKNSLQEVRRFLEELGNPDRKIPVIHVAGTNGKGSVCAFLTSVMGAAGFRAGTFVSPHLNDIRERFLIAGQMTENEPFERAFERVLQAYERLKPQGILHPTFFEFLFYMAVVLFEEEGCDLMILETGMGGRLDTTNVTEQPRAAVITSISMDHTQYLGDTIEKIAAEKAGIIKPGVPVIYEALKPEVCRVIEEKIRREGAVGVPVLPGDAEPLPSEKSGIEAEFSLRNGGRLRARLPFEGLYQVRNAALAVRTAEMLRRREPERFAALTNQVIQTGLEQARWPGRMEEICPDVYLDGAHNPDGIEAFLQTAKRISSRKRRPAWLLFGAVSDKDYREMARELTGGLDWQEIGVVHIDSERGLGEEQLRAVFEAGASCPVSSYHTAGEALKQMRQKAKEGILFCAGSLYLIGELRRELQTARTSVLPSAQIEVGENK